MNRDLEMLIAITLSVLLENEPVYLTCAFADIS